MVADDAYLRAWLATPDAAERLDVRRLSAEDANRWRRIMSPRRRRDWASSRALLTAVPEPGRCSRSLSHSRGFAALAMAHPRLSVGVDVEAMAPRNFLRIADMAFTRREAIFLGSLHPAKVPAKFYEYWTLKEAFAKALALPLTEALTRCHCVDDLGNEALFVPTVYPWRAKVFAPRSDLRLAIACVSESVDQIPGTIVTQEWPAPATSDWPVVLDLVSTVGTCAEAPDAAPSA